MNQEDTLFLYFLYDTFLEPMDWRFHLVNRPGEVRAPLRRRGVPSIPRGTSLGERRGIYEIWMGHPVCRAMDRSSGLGASEIRDLDVNESKLPGGRQEQGIGQKATRAVMPVKMSFMDWRRAEVPVIPFRKKITPCPSPLRGEDGMAF